MRRLLLSLAVAGALAPVPACHDDDHDNEILESFRADFARERDDEPGIWDRLEERMTRREQHASYDWMRALPWLGTLPIVLTPADESAG